MNSKARRPRKRSSAAALSLSVVKASWTDDGTLCVTEVGKTAQRERSQMVARIG